MKQAEAELEEQVCQLEHAYGLSSTDSSWRYDLFLRVLVLKSPEFVAEAKQYVAHSSEHQKGALPRQIEKCRTLAAHSFQPSVQIELSFEDQSARSVFDGLKGELSIIHHLWAQKAERADNPSHYVHVVAASGCRLELGHELSKNRMEEILDKKGQKEVFVLTLHLGMRAPPIQFTSPYGDRIKIGQLVYTDRGAPLLELVPDAEGAPLSVCKSKFDAFLHNGGGNGGESNNREEKQVHCHKNDNATKRRKGEDKTDPVSGDWEMPGGEQGAEDAKDNNNLETSSPSDWFASFTSFFSGLFSKTSKPASSPGPSIESVVDIETSLPSPTGHPIRLSADE